MTSPLAPPAPGRASLCTGLLAAGLALAIVHDAGERLFVHTIGIVLIADLAPLLIVLGLPRSAPVWSRAPRVLAHPLVALPLWALALGVWHLPACYEAALRLTWVQALQCATLLGCGLNMWMCLLRAGPPAPPWFGERATIAGILTSRLLGAILANVLLWSGTVLYPYYARGDAIHNLSPVADQNIAGAIILAQEALLTLGLLCWLLARTAVPAAPHPQPPRLRARPGARRGARHFARHVARYTARHNPGHNPPHEPATGAYARGEAEAVL